MTDENKKSGNEAFRLSFGDTDEGAEGKQVELNPDATLDDQFLWHNSAALLDGLQPDISEPAIAKDVEPTAEIDAAPVDAVAKVDADHRVDEVPGEKVGAASVAVTPVETVSVEKSVAAQDQAIGPVAPAALASSEQKPPLQDNGLPIDVLTLGAADATNEPIEQIPEVLQPAILSQPEPTGKPWLMYSTLGLGAALLLAAITVGVTQRDPDRLAGVAQREVTPTPSGQAGEAEKQAEATQALASLDPDLVSAQVVVGTINAAPNRDQQKTLLPKAADSDIPGIEAPLRVDQSREVANTPEVTKVTRVETPITTNLSLPGQPVEGDELAMVVPKSIGFASANPTGSELDLPSVTNDPLPEIKADQRGVTKKLNALRTAAIERRNTALQSQIQRVSDGIGRIGLAGQSLAPEIETASLVTVSDAPPKSRRPSVLASVDDKALSSDAFQEVALPTRPKLNTVEPETDLVDVAALDVAAPAVEGTLADALTTSTPAIVKPSASQTSAGSVGQADTVTARVQPASVDAPLKRVPRQEQIEVAAAAILAPSQPQVETDEVATATEEAPVVPEPEVAMAAAPAPAPEPLVETTIPEPEVEISTAPEVRPKADEVAATTPATKENAADDTQIMFIAGDPADAIVAAPQEPELPTSPFVSTATWRTALNITSLDVQALDATGLIVTASQDSGLPDWAIEGAIVRAVNGVPVSTSREFYDALLIDAAKPTGQVTAFLTIQSSADAAIEDVRVDLPIWRYLALKDGTEIEIVRKSGKWRANIVTVGVATEDGIAAGDVLVRDYATKTKIDTPFTIEQVLAELEETAEQLGFAVVRDGALSDASIVLTTE